MLKRERMSSSHSKSVFRKGAMRVHKRNGLHDGPMRGGIRF